MDDAPGKFKIFSAWFLKVLLNWCIWIHFGILLMKVKVLHELLLFDFVTSEKLLCSGTTSAVETSLTLGFLTETYWKW